MSHLRKVLICTALLGLTLTKSGEAQPSTFVLGEHLSDREMFCQVLGEFASIHALGRDAGLSYLHVLNIARQGKPRETALERTMQEAVELNLRLLYDRPHVTPAQTRSQTEVFCMRSMERRSPQPRAGTGVTRYSGSGTTTSPLK